MAMDEYFQESSLQSEFNEDEKLKSNFDEIETNNSSGDFDCNICLDLVRDPVVTFCGHLYCWPCIYRWISSQNDPKCPVCKTEVSQKTLIPLYGRGQDKVSGPCTLIPNRPSSPSCHHDNMLLQNTRTNRLPPHRPNYEQLYYSTHLSDPMIGMFGEMVYSSIFGNTLYTYPNSYNLTGSNSSRLRRRMMKIDRSLSRVCFFLCCCVMMCLLLF